MKELTTKQSNALKFLKGFIEKKGFPPSSMELGEGLGISQTAAMGYLVVLEKKGVIKRSPVKPRAITIL